MKAIIGKVHVAPSTTSFYNGKPIDSWHVGKTNIEAVIGYLEDDIIEVKINVLKKAGNTIKESK